MGLGALTDVVLAVFEIADGVVDGLDIGGVEIAVGWKPVNGEPPDCADFGGADARGAGEVADEEDGNYAIADVVVGINVAAFVTGVKADEFWIEWNDAQFFSDFADESLGDALAGFDESATGAPEARISALLKEEAALLVDDTADGGGDKRSVSDEGAEICNVGHFALLSL